MTNSFETTTRVQNATISVTGVLAQDTSTTINDIVKTLILRHIQDRNEVDFSAVQSEYVTQAKEVSR